MYVEKGPNFKVPDSFLTLGNFFTEGIIMFVMLQLQEIQEVYVQPGEITSIYGAKVGSGMKEVINCLGLGGSSRAASKK